MIKLFSLSPETISKIARGAVSLEQVRYYNAHGCSNYYRVVVTYPNGYGASIVCDSGFEDRDDCWSVALTDKDGTTIIDSDGELSDWSDLTEEGVINICDYIYFIKTEF